STSASLGAASSISLRRLPARTVSHAPFNAVRRNKTAGKNQVANTLQQQALGDLLPPAIKMIVSGHIHMFEALSFGDAKPPRAGTKLAKKPKEPADIDGAPVTAALMLKNFRYMRWDRHGVNWNGRYSTRTVSKLRTASSSIGSLPAKRAETL